MHIMIPKVVILLKIAVFLLSELFYLDYLVTVCLINTDATLTVPVGLQITKDGRLFIADSQNNNIRLIQNLENLPNLIFLDLYNNKLSSLEGPLSCITGLRVLMAGKNRIPVISNLANLRKLDVLDLHSNEIKDIEGKIVTSIGFVFVLILLDISFYLLYIKSFLLILFFSYIMC